MISSAVIEPQVSVVIPTYNRRALLERAVASALAQADVSTEVIICDDGSTDGTQAQWEHCADPRVRYLPLPHGGACAARNAGIRAAKGAYISFLDSDDTWHPNKLALQLALLRKTEADVVACGFNRYEPDGTAVRVPDDRLSDGLVDRGLLLRENFLSTQTLFGRAECIKDVLFDERFPRMQDWDFVLALTKKYRLWLSREPLADVYVQSDSLSVNKPNALTALRMLMEKYGTDYAMSYVNTSAMLDAIELYAARNHVSSLGDCLHALSGRWTMKQNARLLIRWAKAWMRGVRGITK